MKAFNTWYEEESKVDPDYAQKLSPFGGHTLINSAMREAWTVFKARATDELGLPDDLDGHDLVDRLFDDDDPAVSTLSRKERRDYCHLMKGLYSLYRNPVMHNDPKPNPAAADAVIALVGICLARIARP